MKDDVILVLRKSLANPFCGDSAPTNTPAKTVPNSTLSAPEVFVEHSPDPATQSAPSITPRNNSLANRMLALQNRTFETFIIAEPQMQAFLGDVERKNTGSTAITITGGAGSGKTRFAFQFINALAQNYKVGHASLEEQPDSKLYFDKVQQYGPMAKNPMSARSSVTAATASAATFTGISSTSRPSRRAKARARSTETPAGSSLSDC